MTERTPEDVIIAALRESGMNYASTADRIMRELKLAGFEVIDMLGDVTREVADLVAETESEGCTCCQVSTESTRADEDECLSCGHLMRSHTRG